jgi:23S rRNA (adenine2503-C2)-methyltransferase
MQKQIKKNSLIGMNLAELEDYVKHLGLEKFRAQQLYKWIYSKSSRSFEEMSDLSKKAQEILANDSRSVPLGSLELASKEESKDGTIKFLFKTNDGEFIESVLMQMESIQLDGSVKHSVSACISSQVGCAVGCSFCATGTLGFKKNLNANEIIEQVLFMQNLTQQRISNIVYMGQGEPLHNYDEVLNSVKLLRDLVGIGIRHITISTSGIVPKLDLLAKEGLQITLALSLHDPCDEDRNYLVPINKKWPVFEVLNSLDNFAQTTKRRVTIEYVLLDGINDSDEKAELLGKLIKNIHCNINLIPYNQTNVDDPYKRSQKDRIKAFVGILKKTSGNKTITVRKERGHDISAACGQLANKHANAII